MSEQDHHEVDERRLRLLIEANERHRSKSRAVASLLAAAAAGLIAALVFAPSVTVSPEARNFGALAAGALAAATGAFVLASLVYAGRPLPSAFNGLAQALLFWRVSVKSQSGVDSIADLEEAADRVQTRITGVINAGIAFGAIGLVALMTYCWFAIFDTVTPITFTVHDATLIAPHCPEYSPRFAGTAERSNYSDDSQTLRLTLDGDDCGTDSDIVIHISKEALTVYEADTKP